VVALVPRARYRATVTSPKTDDPELRWLREVYQPGARQLTVRAVLAETGLPPQQLQLELTEGLLMSQSEQSLALMHQLRALGVSLAIDDFGTGYSSLAYLRSFPVDTLKIDRSFIRDLGPRPEHITLVYAIVQLGHNLGMKVTAEGIETAEQRSQLADLRCDTGQGYFLGRPVPEEVYARLLASGEPLVPAVIAPAVMQAVMPVMVPVVMPAAVFAEASAAASGPRPLH